MSQKINIAIDGFSSCGKSTLAKALASQLNYTFIDSGAMYRAITLYAIKQNAFENDKLIASKLVNALENIDISFSFNNSSNKAETFLNGENVEQDIRGMAVSSRVSFVSQVPEVREKLVELQQKLGEKKGVVMDGRDIGTNVFPTAELKLFITAKPEIRAQRRWLELKEKGQETELQHILDNLSERDYQDMNRALNPLTKAEDAIEIDNSNLSREEQLQICLRMAEEAIMLVG